MAELEEVVMEEEEQAKGMTGRWEDGRRVKVEAEVLHGAAQRFSFGS